MGLLLILRKLCLLDTSQGKMKVALVLLVVFAAALQALPDSKRHWRRCDSKTNKGCDEDECCILNAICLKYREEGDICGFGRWTCGCGKGLVCKREKWWRPKKCVDDGGSGDFAFDL